MNLSIHIDDKLSPKLLMPTASQSRREAFVWSKLLPLPKEIAVVKKRTPLFSFGKRKQQDELKYEMKLSPYGSIDTGAVIGSSGRSIASSITCDLDGAGMLTKAPLACPMLAYEENKRSLDLKPFIPRRQASCTMVASEPEDSLVAPSDHKCSISGSRASPSTRSVVRTGSDSAPTKPRRSCSFESELSIDDSTSEPLKMFDLKPNGHMHSSLPELSVSFHSTSTETGLRKASLRSLLIESSGSF